MSRPFPRLRLPNADLAAALAIALAAFAAAAALRAGGVLERADLSIQDGLVRAVTSAGADERFAVVLESEQDLARWGFPLSDDTLAQLIERLTQSGALAVAIDKYRDRPVAPGTERLDALLARADRVYWVERFGSPGRDGVPAPAALERRFAGCGDIVDDADGNVRRALLYLDHEKGVCYSLAFLLARHAGAAMKLAPRFAADGAPRLDFGRAELHAIDPGDGPYARGDAAGFQVPVPTAAGLPRMAVVGLTDVLEGRVAADRLRGRVVLFGSAAASLRDFFNAPSATAPEGHEKIPGVQVHALFASYLLRAATGEAVALRLAPASVSYALAAFLALAGGLIGCSRKRPWVLAVAGAAILALYASATWSLAARGIHLAPAAPALALVLALGAGIARRAWIESRERAELMLVFSRQVSPEIAEILWERRHEFLTGGVIMPRAITATVLFLDIRSFTTVTERLPAEQAIPWLNRGLAAMTETIMRHHGVVTRFIGDAIMAVFGAPIPRTTPAELAADAHNAICAGLAIGPALDRLNREFSAQGLPPIRVRVGINTGTMTQCSVGTRQRMEFTVLGDAVNTASRLESYAMEDDGTTARVLIGERTMELAGGCFRTRHVGDIALKGKETPVSLHQVLNPSIAESSS